MDGIVIDLRIGVVMVVVVVDGCEDEGDECALFFILRFVFFSFASNDRR